MEGVVVLENKTYRMFSTHGLSEYLAVLSLLWIENIAVHGYDDKKQTS
jgi:hypothetical protein